MSSLTLSALAAPALFAFSTLITPGPNNIIIATTGVNFGLRKSAPTILGVCFGFAAMMFFVALGLGELFKHYPALDIVLRIAGALFMCYLAWGIATANVADGMTQRAPPGFKKLVLFQWINPKAWAMASGASVAFLSDALSPIAGAALLAGVFLSVSLPCQFLWGLAGAALSNYLRANPLRLRVFNILMATLMLLAFIPAIIDFGA